MTDKKLSDTTDQELVLGYVDQLKQDNKRLQKELDAKSRPVIDFTSLTKLLRDISNHWIPQTAFGISIAIICILTIYWLVSISGPNGKYYVDRYGTYIMTPESDCVPPASVSKPCFRVMGESVLGQDDYIDGCYSSMEGASKAASEFAEEWRKLHGGQEAE
jgi:hypothetical protein